jgi:tetratricopeptide (TPR) repeat protein
MKAGLSDIKRRYKEGNYQEALHLIEEAERDGILHPEVLVWKGRCLQLLDEGAPHQLSDIESTFRRALEIDNNFTPATLELAWFYLNVLDDAEQAAQLFEAAVSSCRQIFTEAVIGMVKCLNESDGKDAARRYLENIGHDCVQTDEINEVLEEIESSQE